MKTFKEFVNESSADGYELINSWTDRGQTHKQWARNHKEPSPTDRHQSTITMWKNKGEEPVYHASHRIEKGYWTYQGKGELPINVTHKSEHSSLEDAKAALENHRNKLYNVKEDFRGKNEIV